MVNKSSEGLAIVLENPPDLWIDDIGELWIATGGYKVRVIHINRDEPQGETDANLPPSCRIGLERLEELPVDDAVLQRQRGRARPSNGDRSLARKSVTMLAVMTIVFVTAILLLRNTAVWAKVTQSDAEAIDVQADH